MKKKINILLILLLSLTLILVGCVEEEEKTIEELMAEEVDVILDIYEQAYLTQDAYLLEDYLVATLVINDEPIPREDFLVVFDHNLKEHYSEMEGYELKNREYQFFEDNNKVATISEEYMLVEIDGFNFDGVYADLIIYFELVDGDWMLYRISVYEKDPHQ